MRRIGSYRKLGLGLFRKGLAGVKINLYLPYSVNFQEDLQILRLLTSKSSTRHDLPKENLRLTTGMHSDERSTLHCLLEAYTFAKRDSFSTAPLGAIKRIPPENVGSKQPQIVVPTFGSGEHPFASRGHPQEGVISV